MSDLAVAHKVKTDGGGGGAWGTVVGFLGFLFRILIQILRGTPSWARVLYSSSAPPLSDAAFKPLPAEELADAPPLVPVVAVDDGLEKLTIVLDLDETLVCAYETSSLPAIVRSQAIESGLKCFELECLSTEKDVEGKPKVSYVTVFERPGLREFLEKTSEFANLVLFTAGLEGYARPLVDRIDVENRFSQRLYRPSTISTMVLALWVNWDGYFQKNSEKWVYIGGKKRLYRYVLSELHGWESLKIILTRCGVYTPEVGIHYRLGEGEFPGNFHLVNDQTSTKQMWEAHNIEPEIGFVNLYLDGTKGLRGDGHWGYPLGYVKIVDNGVRIDNPVLPPREISSVDDEIPDELMSQALDQLGTQSQVLQSEVGGLQLATTHYFVDEGPSQSRDVVTQEKAISNEGLSKNLGGRPKSQRRQPENLCGDDCDVEVVDTDYEDSDVLGSLLVSDGEECEMKVQ